MTDTTAAVTPVRAGLAGLAGLAVAAAAAACAPAESDPPSPPPTEPGATSEPSEPASPEPGDTGAGEWTDLGPRWTISDSQMPPLYEYDEAFGFVTDPTTGFGARGNVTFPSTAEDVALATVFMGAPNTDVASLILVGLDPATGAHRWSRDTGFGAACAWLAAEGTLGCAGERVDLEAEPPITDHPFEVLDVATGEVLHEAVIAAPGMRTVTAQDTFVTAGYLGDTIAVTRLGTEAGVIWERTLPADPGSDGLLALDVAGGLVAVMDGSGATAHLDLVTGEPASAPEGAVLDVAWSGGTMTLSAPIAEDSASPTLWTAHDPEGTALWQLEARGAPQARTSLLDGAEYLVFAGVGEVSVVTTNGTLAAEWAGDIAPQTLQGLAISDLETEVVAHDLLTGEVAWSVPLAGRAFLGEQGWFEAPEPQEDGTSHTLTYYEPRRAS